MRGLIGVTAITGVATLFSFVSYIVTANYFGASAEMDAYLTAAALPVSVVGIVATALGLAVVPILTGHRDDENKLNNTRNSGFLLVLGLAVLVSLVGSVLAGAVVKLNAPRLGVEKFLLARNLQRVLWIGGSLSMVANFLGGVRYFQKRFIAVAVLPLLPPVCMILGTVALAERFGIMSLAWGYLAGCFLQCVIVAPAARTGKRSKVSRGDWYLSARSFVSTAIPIGVSLLIFGMIPVLDVFWSSRLPDGSLSYLGYGFRIVVAIGGITVHGIAVVLFPFLAEHAADGELSLMGTRLAMALRFCFALTIPIAFLLTVLRVPVLALVFQRGSFDDAATQGVAAVLPWYLAGMVGMASTYVLARGVYSLSSVKVPAVAGIAVLALYWALSGLLSAKYSYVGIGMAYAIYWTVCLILASAYLHRSVGRLWEKEQMVVLFKVLGVSILAAIATYGAGTYIHGAFGQVGEVAVPGVAGLSILVPLYYFLFWSHHHKVDASGMK